MNPVLDVLLLRRVRLEYISPPICQAILSGSGSSLMLEAAFAPPAPTGLAFSGQCERFLTWVAPAETVCTSLYKAHDPNDPLTVYVLEADCIKPGYVSLCSEGWWCYSTLDANGVESNRSDPVLVVAGTRTAMQIVMPTDAVRFNLFRNPDPNDVNGVYTLVLSSVATGAFEVCDLTGLYKLQTISEDGASELSAPISHTTYAGCIPYVLHDITGSLDRYCVHSPYTGTFTAVGGNAPYLWELASGTLPPGLTLHIGLTAGNTTLIDGTPTAGGSYTFSVRCTDVSGHSLTLPFTMIGFGLLDTGSIPDVTTDTPYSYTLTPSGGTAPYTYSTNPADLPLGLSLGTSTGIISGTDLYDVGGLHTFTVTITDATGWVCSSSLEIIAKGCPTPVSFPTLLLSAHTASLPTPADKILHWAFDQSRRVIWMPRITQAGDTWNQKVYRMSTLSTPTWLPDATDSHNFIDTAAKGSLSNNLGRCFIDTKYQTAVMMGSQGYNSFYDLDTADCVACVAWGAGIPSHNNVTQPSRNDMQQLYDAKRGLLYGAQISPGAGGVSVIDCDPAKRYSVDWIPMNIPSIGGNGSYASYVPLTNKVYFCDVNTGYLYHTLEVTSKVYTYSLGPLAPDTPTTMFYCARANLLIIRGATHWHFVQPAVSGDQYLGSATAAGGILNFGAESGCTNYLYFDFGSATNLSRMLLTSPYTVSTLGPANLYAPVAYDLCSGLLWSIVSPSGAQTKVESFV